MRKLSPPERWIGPVRMFDEQVDAALDRVRGSNRFVDRLMYAASELGDFSLIWHLLGAAQGLRSDRDAARAVRLSAVLGIESVIVNAGVKSLFRRERPIQTARRPHKLRQPKTSSFPSGHASAAACAAVLLCQDDSLAPLWLLTAAIVSTSRAYVKIHHASDVVAGLAIGAVIGATARRVWPLPAA